MAAELGKREVAAPLKDWLSKSEVYTILDVSERTLDRLVERGEFPRPVTFPGQNSARWRWVDVSWYLLGREVSDRLVADPEAPPDDKGPSPAATR